MNGALFIISGPSGSGKTTLLQRVLSQFPELVHIVTYTTRPPRIHELNGLDYFFVKKTLFKEKELRQFFLETNYYNHAWYGTPQAFLAGITHGTSYVVVPDINGARDLLKKVPSAITIWITAPYYELEKRLLNRKTDPKKQQLRRLKQAILEEKEAQKSKIYQHTIINNDLKQASKELLLVIRRHMLH